MSNVEDIARQFISSIPHCHELGMKILSLCDGTVSMQMPYDRRFIGDPDTEVLHGGAVSALMDSCCGAAVMCHPCNPKSTATIDLRIDYMRSATPGQSLTTTATCYHVTRTIAFVRATTIDEDSENPVAMATGTFTLQRSQT